MEESRIKTLLTVLPVLSAGLYLFGATYLQGYLAEFGIEGSMFPAPVDRLLFSGFLALVSFGLVPFIYTFMAMLALVAAVIVAAALSSAPRVKRLQSALASKLQSMRSNEKPSPAVSAILDKSETVYTYTLGAFSVALLLALSAALSAKTGKEQAQKEIEQFSQGKGKYVQLSTETTPAATKARQIICGATHCAFWDGSGALVLRHEQIKQLKAHRQVEHPVRAQRSATSP